MKAVLCKEWGPPESLVVEEVPSPVPGPGEVLIEVHAAGVNFPDTLIIQKKYQFQPPLPFSPGGEVAGVVKSVGEGVRHQKPGDRVIGSNTWGGYAQELVVKAERVVPIPDGMDFVTASAYVLAYGTSLHALKDRAKLAAGETLLVLGAAGGVGIAAVEIGKSMGARVIAAASSDDKLALCREHGADETINYATEDLRERIK
ncbi:MAG: NADPH:quinone oxidoreductase family protein, partial [Gammaproteobacteria bacterium]